MRSANVALDQHLTRAARHRKVGDALADAGDEWAAVCYFYSVYHLIRHAIRSDPIFDDPTPLSRVNVALTPADRDTARHKGRKNAPQGREWGVNELVTVLYRSVGVDYERLHQASIEVRYGTGLALPPLPDLVASLDAIAGAHSRGALRFSPPTPAPPPVHS